MLKCHYDYCGNEAFILESRPIFRANATIFDLDQLLKQCPGCAQRQKMKEMGVDTMSLEEYESWLKKFNANLKQAREDTVRTDGSQPKIATQSK